MKIGLIDIDSHNFPNLALMKISAYHKNLGDDVEFINYFNKYDKVYKSKIFTFTKDNNTAIQSNNIIEGGTGSIRFSNQKLSNEIEHIYPDYSLYKYKHALGFLTRGCPNKCDFCIVPTKEGGIQYNTDIEEFWRGQKVAILLDNNVLAHEKGLEQIEKCIRLGIKIDFNQGLDSLIISKNPDIARLLSRVKWFKPIRMACDHKSQMPYIEKATKLLRKFGATPKNYFIYVLVKDVQDALERVEFLKNINLDPFAQPYIDFSGKNKITKEQKRFARWVNHKAIFKTIKYEDYK